MDILDKLTIRPSSVDNFYQCPQQWKRVFLDGETSIPGARAAIGTAVHRGVEVMWNDAIAHKKKDANISMMVDASIEAFKEEEQLGLNYDNGEDNNTAAVEIVKGVEAFVEDIVPFSSIPDAVEQRFTVEIPDHPIVGAISGTVDYIAGHIIADVKTSKRKPTVANYETQQSIYKILANKNGQNVTHNLIQGVVFKKQTEGVILEAAINEQQAKNSINNLLETLELYSQDVVDPDLLFRGNPKYFLCSPKYCSFYNNCKFIKGDL